MSASLVGSEMCIRDSVAVLAKLQALDRLDLLHHLTDLRVQGREDRAIWVVDQLLADLPQIQGADREERAPIR
eukprot:8637716-Alexandrium_andersonii.AAC.1